VQGQDAGAGRGTLPGSAIHGGMGLQAAQSPVHPPGARIGHSFLERSVARRTPKTTAFHTHLAGATRTGRCDGPGEVLGMCG
jgi:hypothetical protein